MKVRSVHFRELDATPAEVGSLLDELGGEHDRLWPDARWPTTPLMLERPLRQGSRAGHKAFRYWVETYEPGRKLVFRFAPGQGLDGTHGFEVEGPHEGRARLTHVFEARLKPWLTPAWPVLRRGHDALVEDLLDCAELAISGRVAQPARWPLVVRAVNGLEVRLDRASRSRGGQAFRFAGIAVPGTLAALAAIHGAWALGWRWPGGDDRAFAERVMGDGSLPPVWATWAAAATLLAAAGTVRTSATGSGSRWARRATWGVAAAFLTRGALGIPADLIGGVKTPYHRLDLTIYSPLSLALGVGAGAIAVARGSEAPRVI